MRIQHNISALNTYRQLSMNNTGTAKSLEKLSSGYKVNRAGDDAAGLAISEKMRAQINGLNRASANAQDGISLIQAAEGALQETHAILQRMRELGVQAANDVNETEDRQAIQDEINQLTKEVDRIAFTTEFNKKTILDGSQSMGKYIRNVSGFNVSSVSIIPANDATESPILNGYTSVAVVGAGEKLNMTYDFALTMEPDDASVVANGKVGSGGTGTLKITLGGDIMISAGLNVDQEGNNELFIAVNEGDTATMIASNVREVLQSKLGADFDVTASGSKMTIQHNFVGNYGDTPFELEFTASGAGDPLNSQYAAFSGTTGKDVVVQVNGEEIDLGEQNAHLIEFESDSGHTVEGTALKGRNSIAIIALGDGTAGEPIGQFNFRIDDATRLSGAVIGVMDGNDLTLQVGANTGYSQTIKVAIESLSASSLGVDRLDVLNHGNAQGAIASIETAITMVSTQRASLGAVQNRLEHTVANLDTVAENLQSAESRIRDVDMAKEMMNFTKFNILVQASQAMMAQANAQPQGVLQLLR